MRGPRARRTPGPRPPARPRRSIAEAAYAELRRRILDNEMPAGFQALEQEVAAMLGISRTPAREALIRLAQEGLVEVRPRHGMRVLPVSPDDMQEIYDVLTGLEARAAEIVAERGVEPDTLSALHRAVDDMDAALAGDDLAAWAEADERFHRLLVDAAGNRRLAGLVETCWDQAHRVRILTLRLRPRPSHSNADHRALVDAIVRRDPTAARELHWAHRVRNGQMLVEILRRYGLKQV